MAYEKNQWTEGDVITSTKLNTMEEGISGAVDAAAAAQATAEANKATLEQQTTKDAEHDAAIQEGQLKDESQDSSIASNAEAIAGLQESDATFQETLTTLSQTVGTQNESICSLQTGVLDLSNRVTILEGKDPEDPNTPVQVTREEFNAVKDQLTAAEGEIDTLQTAVESATADATAAKESAEQTASSLSTLGEAVTANTEALSTLNETVETQNTTLGEMSTTIEGVNTTATQAAEGVTTLSEKVNTVESSVGTLTENDTTQDSAIEALNTLTTSQGESITALQKADQTINETITGVQSTVSTINETVQSHAAAIAELQGHGGESVQHPITTEEVVAIKGRITANESAIAALKEADTNLTSADAALGNRITPLEAIPAQLETINGSLSTLSAKDTELEGLISAQNTLIAELQEQIYDLTPATEVTLDTNNATVDMTGKKVNVTLGSDMPDTVTVTARDVTVTSPNTESQIVAIAGTDSITITNPTSAGSLGSNSVAWQLNTNGNVLVDGGTLAQGGYNAFNISLNSGYAVKNVHVKDVEFTGTLSNNAVSVYRVADNANILIENCHFTSVSNLFRFSNATNATGITITLKNCKVDAWESRLNYSGLVIFQDYTSSAGKWRENNLFASDKITLNIIDCTGPHGPIMPAEPSAVYATHDENQLAYVYIDAGGSNAQLPYSGNESRFPTLNIQNSSAAE